MSEHDTPQKALTKAEKDAEASAEIAAILDELVLDEPSAQPDAMITSPLTPNERLLEGARNFAGALEEEKKAKRAAGKAAFDDDQALKPKKHPDDYRYTAANGVRTRQEIEQYRRENPEAWNEYQRIKYALKAANEGRTVRSYTVIDDPEAKAKHRRTQDAACKKKQRAAQTPEQIEERRAKDAERKRLARAAAKSSGTP